MARSCGNLNFVNKNYTKSTRAQVNKWVKEIVALYGTQIDYFVYDYKLERQDGLLGEDRPAKFKPPVSMKAIVNINNDNLMLSKFGLQTTSDLTAYIDYQSYANAIGNNLARPKAGDLIRLTELGFDRPLSPYGFPYYQDNSSPSGDASGSNQKCASERNECDQPVDLDSLVCCTDPDKNTGDNTYSSAMDELSAWNTTGGAPFGPNIYEITTVKDEDLTENLNPLMGHYAWKIQAIRFDNSYQPDAPVENGSNMVNDAPYYGKLPGGTNTPENPKKYPQTTDKEEDTYWDHNKYKLDNVYGGYGYKPKDQIKNLIDYNPKTDPYDEAYWVVQNSLPLYNTDQPIAGNVRYFNLHVETGNLVVEESASVLTNAKARYYIRDTGNCVDPNRLIVYTVFVYDSGIAVQYFGDMAAINDVIFTSIFLTDKQGNPDGSDAVARLWIGNGKLLLTTPVTEDNPTGKEEKENSSSSKEDKFSEENENPEDLVTNSPNQFELGDLDDPFANL